MNEPFTLNDNEYFSIRSWTSGNPTLVAGFTTKNGGTSKCDFKSLNMGFHVGDDYADVVANRAILAEKLGFPLKDWVGAEQTHETFIKQVSRSDAGKGAIDYPSSLKATDGLYSDEKQVLLTLCYADCVPLYFYAPKYAKIGMAHAGWKGTVSGIARRMVEIWNEEGIPSSDIYAVVGPSICKSCYIVDDKIINLVQILLEENDEKPYNLISKGQYQLDLKKLNAEIMVKAGIPRNQIEVSTLCTSCENNLFFSHRRDQGKTGRLMSFIGWKED